MINFKMDNIELKKIVLNLNGPDGNVFVILANVLAVCKVLGYSKQETEEVKTFVFNHKYEETCEMVKTRFGDFITLYRA